MNKYIIIFTLFTTSVFAQTPTEYNLKVTPAEVDLISEGLQTQPFGKVFPLINKLRQQLSDQQPKTEPKVEPKPEVPK